jgi:hypothetical protein
VADEYEIRINTDISSDGVSAFIAQVTSALSEIESRADAAAKSGGSLKGLTGGVERLRSQAQSGISGAGLSDDQQRHYLRQVDELFRQRASAFAKIAPQFRSPLNSRDELVASRREVIATAAKGRNGERNAYGYEVDDESLSPVQRAALAKRNSAHFNNSAANSEEYRNAALAEAIGHRRNNTAYNSTLTGSPEYQKAFADNETSKKVREAAEQGALSTEQYADANALAAAAILNRRAIEENAKTASERYITAEVSLATEMKDQAAEIAKAKAASPEYRGAYASDATAGKNQEAAQNAALSTEEYARAVAQAAASAIELKVVLDAAKTGSTEYIEAEVQAAVELKARQAALAQAKVADDDYISETAAAAASMAALKAAEAEAIAATGSYADEARAKLAEQRNSRNVTQSVLEGGNADDYAQQGSINAAQARQKLAIAQETLANQTDDDIQAAAALKVAQEEYARKLKDAVAELQGTPSSADASYFQRFQAKMDPNPNADPNSKRTMGQFVGSHAANTLGYAVPGLAFGVGIEELSKSVQEAEQAQKVFAELDAQFEALGQSNQLSGFTQSIKDISSNTGLAVSEVAELGMAMKGVYGNTQQATIALQGVSEGAVAMGLNIQEAQQDFTAITQSFTQFSSQGGAAITSVSNEILHLQDLTGVDGKNILEGTADAASSMQQLGIGFKPTASLVAAASERSGLPTDTIGQTLAKVADGITQNYGAIADVIGESAGGGRRLRALNGADPTQELTDILRDFKGLAPGQQLDIESSLGVNASARPAINALVEAANKGTELSKTQAPADRTQEEFKKQMDTLEGSFDRLRQDAVNLGVALIDGPFGKAIVQVANVLGGFVEDLSNLGKTTDGVSTALLELGVAAAAVKTAMVIIPRVINIIQGLGAASATTATEVAADGDASAIAAGRVSASGTASLAAGGAAGGAGLEAEEVGGAGLLSRAGAGAKGFLGQSVVGEDASIGGPELLAAAATAYAGYKIGGAINHNHDVSNFLARSLESGNDDGRESWQAGVAIGSNPYATTTEGRFGSSTSLTGAQFSKRQQAAQQSWLTTMETEINAMSLHATAEQKYAIKLDEQYSNMGSEDAYHNLQTIFTNIGATRHGQDVIHETQSQQEAANPLASHVFAHDNAMSQQAAAAARAVREQTGYTSEAAKDASQQMLNYQGIESAYEAGQVSLQTLVKSSQGVAKEAQQAYNKSPTQATYEALETALQNQATTLDQMVTEQTSATQALAQTGNVSADQANIQRLSASIGHLKTPAAMLQTAQGIVSAMQTQVQDEANMATSLTAQQAILARGVTASNSELAAYNKAQRANGLATVSSLTIRGQAETPTEHLAALNQTTQAIQAQAVAAAHEDPVAVALANYHAAMNTLANDTAAGYGPGSPQWQADQAAAKEAAQTLADSQNQVREATDQLRESTATAAGDTVGAAEAAQALARQQIADAHGLAAQEAAEGSLVTANAQYYNAMTALMVSRTQTAAALAGEQGNPVEQAEDQLRAAQQQLIRDTAYAKAHGINPANSLQVQQDTAAVYTQQQQVLQEQISNIESIGQTEVFLGQETVTQYIAQLEAELVKVKGNKVLTEQVLQDIRNAQNSAGGNLDFDIPANLLVSPTLYQAERVNQFSSGYVDNKQVTVNVNVQGGNTANAVNKILQATGATTGTGTSSMPSPVLSSR